MNKRYYSYNKTHPLAHQYAFGDALKQQWQAPDWNKVNMGGLANAAIGVVGNIINPNGNTSKAGNLIGGVGDVISVVNPLWGAALKGVGMFANAAFGSNVNTEAVNGLRSDLLSARDSVGNSLTWDTLVDNIQDLGSIDVEGADLGSQGWLSHAVDKERNKLRAEEEQAQGALAYATNNINTLQNRQAMGTLLADGGGIHIKPSKKGTFTAQATKMGMGVQEAARHILANKENYSPAMVKKANFARNASKWHAEGGPIFKTDYDMGLTFVNAGGTHEQNPYGGVFMGMAPDGQPNQVEEGEVIFNDYVYSNRLKVPKAVRNKYKLREKKDLSFADAIEDYIKKNGIEERNNDPIANRGLEAFASELAMEQEMIKAKKEMKESRQAAFGGHLFPDGGTTQYGDYTGDYNKAWGTYVMPGVEKYFTDALAEYNAAADDAARAAIRQRVMDQVNAIQESYAGISSSPLGTKNKNIGAHQTLFNAAGGNYGFNGANESIPGIDALIKRGYTGSTSDNAAGNFAPDDIYGWRTNLRHFGSDSPEDAAAMERIASMANQMKMAWGATLTDPGHEGRNLYMLSGPREIENPLQKLAPITSGAVRASELSSKQTPEPEEAANTPENPEVQQDEESTYDPTYWWRMAGLSANAAGLMYNIFDPYRPRAVNEARYTTMNPKYIGDYLQYRPEDINYTTSQLDANNAALRNSLMQSVAPSRAGSLLAADFNANTARGTARRQALEYNDALRKAVGEFNRGTNQFNAQMYVDAATKNQAAKQAYFQDRLRQAQFNSQLDFQHKMMRDQAIGQGLTAIGDYLNDIGREDVARAGAEVYASTMPTKNKKAEEYTGLVSRRRPKKTTKSNKGD